MMKFNREEVFAEVDKSSQRFETYTAEQRKEFRQEAHEVMPAPQWLVDRMEALHKLPPPTIEEVRAQWKASMKLNEEECFKNPYKDVNYIR